MNYSDALERIQAAQQILSDTSITREKFGQLQKLLKGVNLKIDRVLSRVSKEWDNLARFEKGEVIDLAAHELPEHTEEEKKRKKLFLFFLSAWKDLQKEVVRVRGELVHQSPRNWGKIVASAKGPLGLVTVLAVGWVLLEATAVEITVANRGCNTLYPTSYTSIPLPGISLPKDPIADGQSGVVRMPPLTLAVDGKTPGNIRLSAFNFKYTFEVPSDVTITFDGEVLNNVSTTLRLGSQKHHDLIVACR
ncbi:hypothetical protein HY410_00205 [Candidatus Gottesmanbacteria bacterium]|nr:hypothetical protein [Candidatus Gottesmanbacteria bacterium]